MSAAQSPLFEPVLWHGRAFLILDESRVPEEIHSIKVTEVAEALTAVRDMKTRAFGQVLTFLYSGALLAERLACEDGSRLRRALADMTEAFCAARPTFDFRGLGACFDEPHQHRPIGFTRRALLEPGRPQPRDGNRAAADKPSDRLARMARDAGVAARRPRAAGPSARRLSAGLALLYCATVPDRLAFLCGSELR